MFLLYYIKSLRVKSTSKTVKFPIKIWLIMGLLTLLLNLIGFVCVIYAIDYSTVEFKEKSIFYKICKFLNKEV